VTHLYVLYTEFHFRNLDGVQFSKFATCWK
jgi:hypothetical protein